MQDKLSNYIYIVKNVLDAKTCDEILNEFINSDEWIPTVVGLGELNKNVRNCEIIGISYPEIIQKNSEVRLRIDNSIFNGASKCIQEYNKIFEVSKALN